LPRPPGSRIITSTIAAPKKTDGAPGAFETFAAQPGTNWMKSAPSAIPAREPSPPTTAPTTSRSDLSNPNVLGLTNQFETSTKSEPPTPA
jgi:hypothetical protein